MRIKSLLEVMPMPVPLEMRAKGTTAVLTLAVPPFNALNEDALQDQMEALDEVENDETIGTPFTVSTRTWE